MVREVPVMAAPLRPACHGRPAAIAMAALPQPSAWAGWGFAGCHHVFLRLEPRPAPSSVVFYLLWLPRGTSLPASGNSKRIPLFWYFVNTLTRRPARKFGRMHGGVSRRKGGELQPDWRVSIQGDTATTAGNVIVPKVGKNGQDAPPVCKRKFLQKAWL